MDISDIVQELGLGKRKANWSERLAWMAAGVAVGASVSYLMDPNRGRARRAELERQADEITREASDTARARLQEGARRAVGKVKDAAPDKEQPGDAVVLERVRSDAIGPSSARNSGIVTTIDHGVVAVRGQVESDQQRRDLFGRIKAVDGVRDVEDLTHLPGEPAPTRS